MTVVLVDNGKSPDEPTNACLFFWLPPDSPYGNLQLKLSKLCQRLDEANRRLCDSHTYWEASRADGFPVPLNAIELHLYANEQAVYLIRRAADEMIALIWCLSESERTGTYPSEIKIDCIGAVLKQNADQQLGPFKSHIEMFQALNEITNAFKHSFVHSDITLIGMDEPTVTALSLHYNKLASGVKFHNFSLSWIVQAFSAFYKEGLGWLRGFSERHS